MRSKIAKTGATGIFVAMSIRKSYGFTDLGGTEEVFRAKIRSQHAVWMHSAEFDVLFRLISIGIEPGEFT